MLWEKILFALCYVLGLGLDLVDKLLSFVAPIPDAIFSSITAVASLVGFLFTIIGDDAHALLVTIVGVWVAWATFIYPALLGKGLLVRAWNFATSLWHR